MMYILISIYTFGFVLSLFGHADENIDSFYEVFLWPLVFIKYILKGLYNVLFKDWK